jgi:hypothetical protein
MMMMECVDEGVLIEANLAEDLLECLKEKHLNMKHVLINTEDDGIKVVHSLDGCGRGWVCMTDELDVYFTTDMGVRHFIGHIPSEHAVNARIYASKEFLACVISTFPHTTLRGVDAQL